MAFEAAPVLRRAPQHAEVGELGQRIAQGGDLPVDDAQHPGLAGMEDHVVEPVVAMHQHRLVIGRQMGGQPVEQTVHRLDLLGLRRLVLLAPARDLARHVAAGTAEIRQAERGVVDGMQAGQGLELGAIDRAPAFLGDLRQQRVPQHAAVAIFHDVEGGADHAVVLAQRVGPGRRHVGLVERRDHPELAVDGMGRRQQLAGRLATQDVAAACPVGQAVGRIGLAALELLGPNRRHEACDALRHEALERPLVETVLLLHLHRADVIRPSSRHPKPLNDRSLWPGVCSPVGAGAITTKGEFG